jgi:beta-N-acetylhexosaminidase
VTCVRCEHFASWYCLLMPPKFVVFLLVIIAAFVCPSAFAKDKYQQPGAVHLDRDGEKWAEKTLHQMSLEEKIGQLFMIWVRAQFMNVDSPEYAQLRDSMNKYHIGSFCMTVRWEPPFLYRNQPYEAAVLLNRLQSDSKYPLLIAADFERGLTMRLYGATEFPHAMAFGATGNLKYAEMFGRITAHEARAIGVQWNFFPDADVNSNPANPIINTRSFGEDPQQVGDMAVAYIKGARSEGMLTTVKHFPGHGDTATDSHLSVAQVTGDAARLNAVELAPFRKAIDAGVDSVMVAHVTVPALEPDPNRVATTSPAIVNGLLKSQMGFQGIVVTDALDMAGMTRLYASDIGRAAVEAFKAGDDLLIIPPDIDAAYRSMLQAAKSGELSPGQVDASVLKILKGKASVGLNKARLVNLDAISKEVGRPENVARGQQIADDAVTLVRDNGKMLPLKQMGTVNGGLPYQRVQEVKNNLVAVILSEDVRSDSGRMLERQILARVPDANVLYVDPRVANGMSDEVLKAVQEAQAVVAAVYVIPTAGRALKGNGGLVNSVSMADATGTLLNNILSRAAEKTVVLAMGNPYVAADFPAVQNYLCAFSNVPVSETSVVKALFGEMAIHGHLPVSIPGIAQRGSGIEREPAVAQGEVQK